MQSYYYYYFNHFNDFYYSYTKPGLRASSTRALTKVATIYFLAVILQSQSIEGKILAPMPAQASSAPFFSPHKIN